MKRLFFAALVIVASVSSFSLARAEMPVPPAPTDGYILDQTNTISPDEKRALNDKIAAYRQQTGVQLAVLLVSTIDHDYLENFSLNVARTWGIGQKGKDNGALLLVVMRDHLLRIEVGRGLEGDLTDARAGRIIRSRITPKFKSGEYYAGIASGIDGMITAINAAPDPLSEEPKPAAGDWFGVVAMGAYFFIAILSWFGAMLGRSKRWWPGGALGAGLGGGLGGLIGGTLAIALISGFVVGFFGLLFDYLVSKNYKRARAHNEPPSWWAGGGMGGGSFGSGGGITSGGFGGGGFSGGGSSGSW